MEFPNALSRRDFVKGAGGLVIGFNLADPSIVPELLAQSSASKASTPAPDRLDAWLRIAKDGSVHVFSGKMDVGTGVQTALTQVVAEELDVPLQSVVFVMGDSALTPDQSGVSNSRTISTGAQALINVAATARFLLLQLASQRLGAPVERFQVRNGIISVIGNDSKNVSYAALVDGNDLNDILKVSGDPFTLSVQGRGKPKDPATYTIIGKSVPRIDMPPKILGQFTYVTDVRIPGMLHGRVIRPPAGGVKLLSIDDAPAKRIAGFVKAFSRGNFVGVVAETEWAAIRAAQEMKITWSPAAPIFPEDLYQHMRTTTPKSTQAAPKKGDAAAALSQATKKLQVTYQWPFQAHATMGPGCAVVDYQADGVTMVWSGTMKPHALRTGIAELLGRPLDQVRVVWVQDSGAYGRCCHEDAAADAALLSRAVGKPVRVQWMRSDMTAWGGKGPAVLVDIVGGLNASGEVTSIQWTSRAFSGNEFHWAADRAGSMLAGQLLEIPNPYGYDEFVQWVPPYDFANVSSEAHIVPPLLTAASPLRTMHLRAPQGPARTFASESFVDELAAAALADPIEYRLKYLKNSDRATAVLLAAAKGAAWEHRPSPKQRRDSADVVIGHGVALAGGGTGTTLATIAEVEVNRRTGAVHVKRLVCAHDCGRIVNPDGLREVVAANLIQSLSRTLKEEVTFDQSKVKSVDWTTYPVVRASDVPEQVDIILINHPENPPTGAGEPASTPTPAAIANAIFDATGARVRRIPFTPVRIKEALNHIG